MRPDNFHGNIVMQVMNFFLLPPDLTQFTRSPIDNTPITACWLTCRQMAHATVHVILPQTIVDALLQTRHDRRTRH